MLMLRLEHKIDVTNWEREVVVQNDWRYLYKVFILKVLYITNLLGFHR